MSFLLWPLFALLFTTATTTLWCWFMYWLFWAVYGVHAFKKPRPPFPWIRVSLVIGLLTAVGVVVIFMGFLAVAG